MLRKGSVEGRFLRGEAVNLVERVNLLSPYVTQRVCEGTRPSRSEGRL